jgi:hypothetical protein
MMAVPFVPEAGGIEVMTLTGGDIWKGSNKTVLFSKEVSTFFKRVGTSFQTCQYFFETGRYMFPW